MSSFRIFPHPPVYSSYVLYKVQYMISIVFLVVYVRTVHYSTVVYSYCTVLYSDSTVGLHLYVNEPHSCSLRRHSLPCSLPTNYTVVTVLKKKRFEQQLSLTYHWTSGVLLQINIMAAGVTMLPWLEILEKQFDKSFVDLDLLLGQIDPDQYDLTFDGRNKMTALSSAFAQLSQKAQAIFQSNAKFEVGLFDSQVEWFMFDLFYTNCKQFSRYLISVM